jgi:hypothetical protein
MWVFSHPTSCQVLRSSDTYAWQEPMHVSVISAATYDLRHEQRSAIHPMQHARHPYACIQGILGQTDGGGDDA